MEDQIERSKQIHKALLDRRPRGPRFAILILIIFAILSLILAFTIAFLLETAPVIQFTKEASLDHAEAWDTIVYSLSYENLGPGDVKDVTIRDTLPMNVTFVSSDPEYDSLTGKTYIWYIGTVTEGANGTITITVLINEDVNNGTILHNVATLDFKDDSGKQYVPMTDDTETLIYH